MPISQRCAAAAALLLASSALAASPAKGGKPSAKSNKSPYMLSGTDIRWVKDRQVKGVSTVPLWGDMTRGPYRAMVKFDAGEEHPLHSHTNDLRLVVVSGGFFVGKDALSAKDYGPGSYLVLPGGTKHVSGCRVGTDCVVFQEGEAKFDMIPAAAEKTRASTK
jgi:hypothetical protein